MGGEGERGACGGVGGGEDCKECGGVVGRGGERGEVKEGWVGSAEGGSAGEVAGGREYA